MKFNYLKGVYEGEAVDGKPQGKGVLVVGGKTYRGVWTDGDLTEGVLHDGDKLYVGALKNLLPHGVGTEYVSRFRIYQGAWSEGKKVGDRLPNLITSDIHESIDLGYDNPEKFKTFPVDSINSIYGYRYKTPLLKEISKAMGMKVMCVNDNYQYPYGYSENDIANAVVPKEERPIYGAALYGREVDGEFLPFENTEDAERLYDLLWDTVFKRDSRELYHYVNGVKIKDLNDAESLYLLNKTLYLVSIEVEEDSDWDEYEGWQSSFVYAQAKVHPLPDGMIDEGEIRAYVAEKKAWSKVAKQKQECNEADTAQRAKKLLFEQCLYELTK